MTDDARSTRKEQALRRLNMGDATEGDPEAILYQHTILCQTGLPYRNPGDELRNWERVNGALHLSLNAGRAMHPQLGRLVEIGLPYGPKPRLILAHLNAQALRQHSPVVEVGDSLTGFVKRLNLDPKGRNMGIIKDQLTRLAASHVTFGMLTDRQAITLNTGIIAASSIPLWFPKNEAQRVLWPSTVRLSHEYFESLAKHAVPLHDKALMALSGSAMGLDVYAWLAQRLHRIGWGKRVFVPWPALKMQFGWHYSRLDHFKAEFTQTLRLVHSQYRAADVELDGKGMVLRQSPTPVKGRTGIVVRTP